MRLKAPAQILNMIILKELERTRGKKIPVYAETVLFCFEKGKNTFSKTIYARLLPNTFKMIIERLKFPSHNWGVLPPIH